MPLYFSQSQKYVDSWIVHLCKLTFFFCKMIVLEFLTELIVSWFV
jgi:hypothetical protein